MSWGPERGRIEWLSISNRIRTQGKLHDTKICSAFKHFRESFDQLQRPPNHPILLHSKIQNSCKTKASAKVFSWFPFHVLQRRANLISLCFLIKRTFCRNPTKTAKLHSQYPLTGRLYFLCVMSQRQIQLQIINSLYVARCCFRPVLID